MVLVKTTRFFFLSILAIVLFSHSSAWGQQVEMSLPEISQQSDRIVQVKVESNSSRWVYTAEGGNIITTTRFQIQESIKGALGKGDSFTLDMPGGTVGDTTQYVSSSVLFTPGEESILFLERDTDYVTGGYQGKFPVENNHVTLENQKVKIPDFIEALKNSEVNPQTLPSYLQKIRVEPLEESAARLKSSSGSNQTGSTNTTYAVSGLKSEFAGGSDTDNDGFYETFTFKIQVNGDVVPGPETVFFRVTCTTTNQTWTSVNSFVVTGTEVDYKNFGFSESNFAGKINGNMTLEFKVEMLDASKNFLAIDESVEGNSIKVDEASVPTLAISSISPDRQSAGTNSEVTITGSGFGNTQGDGKVEFYYRDGKAKIAGDVLNWSDKQITCTVPIATVDSYPASAGSGPVTVTNDGGQVSNAYNYRITFSFGGTQWAATSMTYRINENYSGTTGEGQAIQNAGNSWNNANANFKFEYGGTHTNTASARNNNNDMVWGTLASSSIIGAASVWSSGTTILECDIVFNNAMTWSTAPTVPSGSIDVETISLHEMGHWLNLRDLYGSFNDGEYDQQKIMYGLSYYGQRKRDLHPDDVAGIQWIYGMAESITISGYVKTGSGTAVSGVVMNGLTGNPSTNTNGFYTAEVEMGWTGTITPYQSGIHLFTPKP